MNEADLLRCVGPATERMKKRRRQPQHLLSRRQAAVLQSIAVLDVALLIALGYGILSANSELVLLVAPTYSALFLVLTCTLASFAERGLFSWRLVAGILLVGPLGAAVALWLCRPWAAQRSPSCRHAHPAGVAVATASRLRARDRGACPHRGSTGPTAS